LVAARLLTMMRPGDPPVPGAVACADGRIVAVGTPEDCARRLPPAHRRIEARDSTLLPGFVDAHVHILAAAAAEAGPDVSAGAVSSIAELLELLRDEAARTPPGAWVRAAGYEETLLAEGRHPTRGELDGATPDHPVRLIQRGGHAEVLNSRALALVGIDESTPEPPGAVFGRSFEDGRLDGLLLGMADAIEPAMPPPAPAVVEAHVRDWARARAAEGVTTLVDAGVRNGPAEWATFERLLAAGAIPQRVVSMESVEALGTLPAEGLDGRLRRGETKLQPATFEGEAPDAGPLDAGVRAAIEAGRRVAMHAPTEPAVAASLAAFRAAGAPPRQRIEHAPLLTAQLIEEIVALGAVVVAQPGLLNEVGGRYRQLLDAEQRARLHPWRALLDAGAALAFSSDAPISRASVLDAVAAASVDRPADLAPDQAIAPIEALYAWTAGASDAARLEDRGRLREGALADLVLIDGPLEQDPASARVRLTVIGGEVAFEAGGGGVDV